jgi:hypothetical protein
MISRQMMPQMKVGPFMARTMVEDRHGVKPLPFLAAPPAGRLLRHIRHMPSRAGITAAPSAGLSESRYPAR